MTNAIELMSQEQFESYLATEVRQGLLCPQDRPCRSRTGQGHPETQGSRRGRRGCAAPVVTSEPAAFDLHALGARWLAGEKISVLAREAGVVWNKLWSDLAKLGYRPQSA